MKISRVTIWQKTLPLYALFGGAEGGPVPVNSSIATGTPEKMVGRIEEARAAGYRSHSAKIGGGDPAAVAHLAAATPGRYLMAACDLSGYVRPRVAPDGPRRDAARLRPAERPGLGISPDESVLGEPIAVYQ